MDEAVIFFAWPRVFLAAVVLAVAVSLPRGLSWPALFAVPETVAAAMCVAAAGMKGNPGQRRMAILCSAAATALDVTGFVFAAAKALDCALHDCASGEPTFHFFLFYGFETVVSLFCSLAFIAKQ